MVIGPRDRGTRATISFIELAEETSLPPALREAPRVRAVSHATCLLMTIGNDLFSFHRENAENTLESNIVGVLASENRTSLHTALACAVALHDCIMCLFLDLTKALEHNAGEPLKRYLAQLGHLVRGNLEYSLIVPRYNSEVTGISPALLDSIEWAEKPSARRLDAPQIPAIAWLWDQL
ncbi:hypothetical protein SAMN04487983_102514 [Streptomyces sp. yr375]|nr:hypothetical protein SAMN04487983_102514 [Streptomyces sp. yr375]